MASRAHHRKGDHAQRPTPEDRLAPLPAVDPGPAPGVKRQKRDLRGILLLSLITLPVVASLVLYGQLILPEEGDSSWLRDGLGAAGAFAVLWAPFSMAAGPKRRSVRRTYQAADCT